MKNKNLMKRALMLLTAAALVLAMAACGAAPEAPVSAADSAAAASVAALFVSEKAFLSHLVVDSVFI